MKDKSVNSDIDDVLGLLEELETIILQSVPGLTTLESISEYSVEVAQEINDYLIHDHNYHFHATEKGHTFEFGLQLDFNHGKWYKLNALGYKPLVDLLLSEMTKNKDMDGNGYRFFHDFVFDQKDKELPLTIKEKISQFMMTGSYKPFKYEDMQDDSGKTIKGYNPYPEGAWYSNEFDIIQIGFDKYTQAPIFIERKKTCQLWTWAEYKSSLPPEMKESYDV